MRSAVILLAATLFAACGDEMIEDDPIEEDGHSLVTTKAPPKERSALPEGINLPSDQEGLVEALGDGKTAEPALDKLVAMGPSVVPTLRDVAMHGTDTGARGWAIKGLSRIEDPSADKALEAVQSFGQAPELVRTWAAAGRVARATDLDAVLALAPLAAQYPSLKRPIGQKVEAFQGELGDVAGALVAMGNDATLQQVLAPAVLAKGHEPLLEVMFTSDNNEARRLAAGFLGTLGQQDEKVIPEIAKAYDFDPKAETVPWKGGALYVPAVAWDRREARRIMQGMIAWHLFCDRKELSQEKNQIYNNIQSVGLHRQAGFDWPANDTTGLITQYAKAFGADKATAMLTEQGVQGVSRYSQAIR